MKNDISLARFFYLALIFSVMYSADVSACTPVAKVIYASIQDKPLVSVIRVDGGIANAKLKADQLCFGDRLKVAKGGRVSIKYYSNNLPETELVGEAEFPVFPTELKTNTKVGNMLGAVLDIGKWFQQGSKGEMTAYMTTRSAPGNAKAFIRTPLDRGEGSEYPFFLRSDLDKIHFFWRGGVSPWTVVLIDQAGNKLFSKPTESSSIVIPLGGLNVKDIKTLKIISSDGKGYAKKLHFENVSNAGLAINPLQRVVEFLYLDSEENWRLQLWSILQDMKESEIRTTLIDHLEKDDL